MSAPFKALSQLFPSMILSVKGKKKHFFVCQSVLLFQLDFFLAKKNANLQTGDGMDNNLIDKVQLLDFKIDMFKVWKKVF